MRRVTERRRYRIASRERAAVPESRIIHIVLAVSMLYIVVLSSHLNSLKHGKIHNRVTTILAAKPTQWFSRLAFRRALATKVESIFDEADHNYNDLRASHAFGDMGGSTKFAAVLLQVGNFDFWDDMLACTANVATAMPRGYTLDVYISRFLVDDNDGMVIDSMLKGQKQGNPRSISDDEIKLTLKMMKNVDLVTVNRFENRGADIGQFLKQLDVIVATSRRYEIILKQHSKTDPIWRQRHIECLCGTPEQVKSIWEQFGADQNLGMVAPKGTVFGPDTPTGQIFPHIVNKYNWAQDGDGGSGPSTAFDEKILGMVHEIHDLIQDVNFFKVKLKREHYKIVAGTAFWIRDRALQTDELVRILPKIYEMMTQGYQENLGLEHALERFIPTSLLAHGMTIADIAPAPRVLAMYFPQFHAFPENDRFWGEKFTEWTLLRPLTMEQIRKPLPVEAGGLGYYDLLDIDVRKAQADLARNAGLTGFVFYHYWFSGPHAPSHHKVMYKVLEQMLIDSEPNMPFTLSWANEPWSRRWTGEEEDILLSQEYGDEVEWKEHFLYLLQFFCHPNYIRKNGKPVFVIYRSGHFGSKLKPMMQLWRKLATENGLPGLHLVTTVGNFVNADNETAKINSEAGMDAAFHFWPQLLGSRFFGHSANETASWYNLEPESIGVSHQYWGAFTGFDRRPRDNNATPYLRSVEEFKEGVRKSFRSMNVEHVKAEQDLNLFFITAWNEWNEQALLEPDDQYQFGYLKALSHNLQHFPVRTIL